MDGRTPHYLIQLLLPLRDNEGQPYEQRLFRDINAALVAEFGGMTAFSRTPAKGIWVAGGHKEIDDVIVVEVMAETLDRSWWVNFRQKLETVMRQSEVVVRSQTIERL